MTRQSLDELIGFYELRCGDGEWSVCWDDRRQILAFYDAAPSGHSPRIELRTDHFRNFRSDLNGLPEQERSFLAQFIGRWSSSRCEPVPEALAQPLDRFVFFLVRWSLSRDSCLDPRVVKLLEWMGQQGSRLAWLPSYDAQLSFGYRLELLNGAIKSLKRRRQFYSEGDGAQPDSSDPETREEFWFTVRCTYDLTEREAAGMRFKHPEVRKAYTAAFLAYLQVLKEDSYSQELNAFIESVGSSVEKEVMRLLQFAGEHEKRLMADGCGSEKSSEMNRPRLDEGLQRVYFIWFVQRYDLLAASRLMWGQFTSSQRHFAGACAAIWLLAVILFGLEASRAPLVILWPREKIEFSHAQIWGVQSGLQLVALFLVAWRVPALINLTLPRALFGSLVTWITIIFMSLPNLSVITFNDDVLNPDTLQAEFHNYLNQHPHAFWLAMPALLLALTFVVREVSRYVRKSSSILFRSGVALMGIFLGSLFWGMIFAYPIKIVLEKKWDPNCSCLLLDALIGASLAALFGIIIQLLWDDKAISEPLEEPA